MSAFCLIRRLAALVALAVATTASAAGPLSVTTRMLVEQRSVAADGTTRVALVAPKHVVPGDRVVVVLAYRNTGTQPIADLVLASPVPRGTALRAAPGGELSVDGRRFAALAGLSVGSRPAGLDDVTAVRWRLPRPLAPGGAGELSFQAVLK